MSQQKRSFTSLLAAILAGLCAILWTIKLFRSDGSTLDVLVAVVWWVAFGVQLTQYLRPKQKKDDP